MNGKGGRVRIVLGIAAVAVIGAVVVLAGPAPVAVGTEANGAVKPHVYDMPPDQTTQVAGALATTKLNWTVASSDIPNGIIRLAAKSRMGLSTDEVTVTVRPDGKNAAVSIVSQAGTRGMDFGANAQHVRDLQSAMDGQLPPG